MLSIIKILLFGTLASVAVLAVFLFYQAYKTEKGKAGVTRELNDTHYPKLTSMGSVKNLTVLPLIDFMSDSEALKTEAGVSYLIRADNTTILLDTGLNSAGSHPSPLLYNMEQLDISPGDIDVVVISHSHIDHVGGQKEARSKTFSLSQGKVDIGKATVVVPEPMSPSEFNPADRVEVAATPTVIAKGVASTGSIPRFLFLACRVEEQSIIVNVEGKGLVLIIGCGHPTIERIIERAKMLSDAPIYAIIGGLHFPISGGRYYVGPLNLQYIVGSDKPPWNGLNETDLMASIDAIQAEKPSFLGLSPHDSSDWSLERFEEAFAEKFAILKVGREITF